MQTKLKLLTIKFISFISQTRRTFDITSNSVTNMLVCEFSYGTNDLELSFDLAVDLKLYDLRNRLVIPNLQRIPLHVILCQMV